MIKKKYHIKYNPEKRMYYIVCIEYILGLIPINKYLLRDCRSYFGYFWVIYFDTLEEARGQIEIQKKGDSLAKKIYY